MHALESTDHNISTYIMIYYPALGSHKNAILKIIRIPLTSPATASVKTTRNYKGHQRYAQTDDFYI